MTTCLKCHCDIIDHQAEQTGGLCSDCGNTALRAFQAITGLLWPDSITRVDLTISTDAKEARDGQDPSN
jgi:hypothetical protein